MNKYQTPKPPTSLSNLATLRNINDEIRCPVCGQVYANQDGFNTPCKHLIAHYGMFGWERTPRGSGVSCIEGDGAFRLINLLAQQGHTVEQVTSGENGKDADWLVWHKPAVALAAVA